MALFPPLNTLQNQRLPTVVIVLMLLMPFILILVLIAVWVLLLLKGLSEATTVGGVLFVYLGHISGSLISIMSGFTSTTNASHIANTAASISQQANNQEQTQS